AAGGAGGNRLSVLGRERQPGLPAVPRLSRGMRILLVGASGFIGGRLLTALRAAGHTLIATARRPPTSALPGVEWQTLDLARLTEDPAHFSWPSGVELLINAAGVLGSDSTELARVQDRGTRRLFD